MYVKKFLLVSVQCYSHTIRILNKKQHDENIILFTKFTMKSFIYIPEISIYIFINIKISIKRCKIIFFKKGAINQEAMLSSIRKMYGIQKNSKKITLIIMEGAQFDQSIHTLTLTRLCSVQCKCQIKEEDARK